MPKLSDREILNIVDSEFHTALGAYGGEIAKERALALNYYNSDPFGNEINGSSEYVTSDVADVVGGMLPSLLKMFATEDNLAYFEPFGPEDEDAAEQESDYINYVFFKENKSFMLLYNWFWDALVQKNGIVKCWWDESEIITTENYHDISEDELLDLLADEELTPIERDERTEVLPDPATGELTEQTLYTVEFRRVCKKGKPRIENVPVDEYRISSDARSIYPDDARMVGQECEIKRSDLIDMGFDRKIVEGLPKVGVNVHKSEERIAKYNKEDDTWEKSTTDKSQEAVLVREAYIKLDYDGDGRSELRKIITSGEVVLSNEPVDRQPFHVLCPYPLPHKHFGESAADRSMDHQMLRSTVIRQYLDNLYRTNRPGHAIWEQAIGEDTLDDLLTSEVGRIARLTRPPAEALQELTVPFTAEASLAALELFDREQADRTGVSSDGEALNPDSLKNIQGGVMAQALDLKKMKIENVARIFAETGIKTLFLHLHEMLQKHQRDDVIYKLRNDYFQTNPTSWRTRYDMTVTIGLGMGNRDRNLLHLAEIWNKQTDIVNELGYGSIVQPINRYKAAAAIVKNANLGKQVEDFFTETNELPEPPGMNEQQQLLEQQQQLEQKQQQLDAQEQQLKFAKMVKEFENKEAELDLKREKIQNELAEAMEKISNQLTEMELKYNTNVPGSKV